MDTSTLSSVFDSDNMSEVLQHSFLTYCSTILDSTNVSLADIFQDHWDPEFLAQIRGSTSISSRTSSTSSSLLSPVSSESDNTVSVSDTISYNQYPNEQNDYSVSNYTVEVLVNISRVYGEQTAEREISKLLNSCPAHLRNRCHESILKRAKDLTVKRSFMPLCAFCRNNGQPAEVYQSHVLRDETGKVVCPILRCYVCPRCHGTGDNAHTIKYCPLNQSQNTSCQSSTSRLLSSQALKVIASHQHQKPYQGISMFLHSTYAGRNHF